jgi:hypothetical protein
MYQVPVVTCRDQIGAYRTDCVPAMVPASGTTTIPTWMILAAMFFVLLSSNRSRGA